MNSNLVLFFYMIKNFPFPFTSLCPLLWPRAQRTLLAVCRTNSAIATRTCGNQSPVASVCVTLEPSCVMKLSARS